MNKNRKRAISRGKFGRIYSSRHRKTMSFLYADGDIIMAHNGFLYWADHSCDTVQYFRKAISEALK